MRATLLAAMLLPALAQAQTTIPAAQTIGYQGRLLRSDGTPEREQKTLTFALYGVEKGGEALWSEKQSVAFANGFYAVFLGSVTPFSAAKAIPLFDGSDRWLGVKVGEESELSPRQKIASVATAIGVVDSAITTAKIADGAVTAAKIAREPWHGPALQNGWVNYESGYALAGYGKDANGVVRLRGLVKSGAVAGTVFTLPAGYRPAARLIYSQQTSPNAMARVDVEVNGSVTAVANVNSGWLSLDGITFLAEQ